MSAARWRDVGAMDALFWRLQRSCDLGRVLEVGCGEGQFVQRLVEHGVSAFGIDRDAGAIQDAERYIPGRCVTRTGPRLPFEDESFDTVVLRGSDPLDVRRVTRRHLCVRATADRGWITGLLREGFRVHPGRQGALGPYLLFEKISDRALAAHPSPRWATATSTGADILRMPGAAAEIAIRRYEQAAALVRPHDTVLELLCGSGAGLAIVAATGRAHSLTGMDDDTAAIAYANAMYGEVTGAAFEHSGGDPLVRVRDNSIDLLIALAGDRDSLWLAPSLDGVARVLKPGGRFVTRMSAEALRDIPTGRFLVERVTAADARGEHVVVAMRDPRAGAGMPYTETVHGVPEGHYRPASVSFPDAYDNPWIRNAMVSQGLRITDADTLIAFAASIESSSGDTSIDRAAAICVQGHRLLSSGSATSDVLVAIVGRIERWVRGAPEKGHHLRWRISLTSLAGRLCLQAGRRDDGLMWFERCASSDASAFSPLLCTKTVDAAYQAGLIHAWNADHESAARWWHAGMEQARRACGSDWREIAGDPASPLTFGLKELSHVLDSAGRCAAGLHALATWKRTPGRLGGLLIAASRADEWRVHELEAAERHRAVDAAPARTDGDKKMERIVVYGADDSGRRLWEALAKRGVVEIVGFVDPDPRRLGRPFVGEPVYATDWLRESTWDRVAVATGRSTEWRLALSAAGVAAKRIAEFPADATAAELDVLAARMFPDPLAAPIAAASRSDVLRVGIFGTGAGAMKVWEAVAGLDTVDAAWFADNNTAQQGTRLFDLDVIAPAAIPNHSCDAVVIGSMSRDPIRKQLLSLGIRARAIVAPDVTGTVEAVRQQLADAFDLVSTPSGPVRR